MKFNPLSLLLISVGLAFGGSTFADAPVIDKSQNYNVYADGSDSIGTGEVQWTEPKQIAKADTSQSLSQDSSIAIQDTTDEQPTKELFSSRIDAMQREIQQLRGLIEVQAHDLKLLRQQQQAFYKDLDQRLANVDSQEEKATNTMDLEVNTPATDKPTLPKSTPVSANPADEEIAYAAAYELVRNKEFSQALPAMKTFISSYPNSQYAPNAHYWLGELLLAEKQVSGAIIEFQTVLSNYPKSTKAAAAMLKLGFAYIDLGETQKAHTQLQQVMSQFPDTSTARLAKARLNALSRNDT